MAKVGAQRASELTGKSKSTIQRAMNTGKLSFEIDANGRRVIDVSELERCFGLDSGNTSSSAGEPSSGNSASVAHELEKAQNMLETERLKMRIKMLEDQLEVANTTIDDLKGQRDQWQKQASQVLITSQYSQKQAEDLAAQLKEREDRARERRDRAEKQRLQERMKKMEAQNQNKKAGGNTSGGDAFNFSGLWKKVKGQ
ncbi:MAG: entry exclusion 1 domain-containing protein [Bdellovibrionales bacterium]